jgi:hypothetical protein
MAQDGVMPMRRLTFAVAGEPGEIVVPANYRHDRWIDTVRHEQRGLIHYMNALITDHSFGRPGHILTPGERLKVKIFFGAVGEGHVISSEERYEHLVSQNAVFAGVHGATLVAEQLLDKLPRGLMSLILDHPDRLFRDDRRNIKLPRLVTPIEGPGCSIELVNHKDVYENHSASFIGFFKV